MYENFEQWVTGLCEDHFKTATANMNDEQKEIYKIGFENAINLAGTYMQFQDEMTEDEELLEVVCIINVVVVD